MKIINRRPLGRTALVLGLATILGACSGEPESAAVDTPSTATLATTDSTADQEFLAKMIGHHQSILNLAEVTMERGSGQAKADAERVHHMQTAERDQMAEMLSTRYRTMVTPAVDPRWRAVIDSLKTLSGAAQNRVFYERAIEHHQEGVVMVDEYMPRLSDPEVRSMAAKMKTDQTAEIAGFRAKVGS